MNKITRPPFLVVRFCSCKASWIPATGKKQLVPKEAHKSKINPGALPPRTKIDISTIALLERLSLVNCGTRKDVDTLEDAIAFADKLLQVDVEGVDPLVSVLESQPLQVRDDRANESDRDKILKNAYQTEEEYFVAPTGNIPLEDREDLVETLAQRSGKMQS